MAKENCVFCGEKLGMFNDSVVILGGMGQPYCKKCGGELKGLSEPELLRQALRLGRAREPEKLRARLEELERVEQGRPKCLRCGAPMHFNELMTLDRSPLTDSIIFLKTFDVIPCTCSECGKIELYSPAHLKKNETMDCLYKLDAKDSVDWY